MPQHKNDMLLVAAPRASMAEVVSVALLLQNTKLAVACVLYWPVRHYSELLLL